MECLQNRQQRIDHGGQTISRMDTAFSHALFDL
jgi:hypothetical protein